MASEIIKNQKSLELKANPAKPIRITIATGLYPPEIGGPATYVSMLERDLPGVEFDLSIVKFSDVKRYPKLIRHILYIWKLFLASKGADFIYALDPVSVGLPAATVSFFVRKKMLLRLGGDYAWEQARVKEGHIKTLDEFWLEDNSDLSFKTKLLKRVESFVASRSALIVVPSEYLKSIVSKWGVGSDKIKVIYSSLDPLPEHGGSYNVSASPSIVSVGRLVPWKGFEAVISAVKKIKDSYPSVVLYIVGSGPGETSLVELIQRDGLSSNVIMTGDLCKSDLFLVVKNSDVFVLNTAYEGLSHQLLEVMAIGTPIVTTSAGGNAELVKDKKNGLIVDFNHTDQIATSVISLLSDKHQATALAEQAKKTVSQFNKIDSIEQFKAAVYELHE